MFTGASTVVTTVATLTTSSYTSTIEYAAAMTSCADLANSGGSSSDTQFNLQYRPEVAWKCVVYNNVFYTGSTNYAGIDASVECSYGYEVKNPI